MAVTPQMMLDPHGPILAEWFPGESPDDLDMRLQIYINEAVAKPELVNADDEDAAVKRWVEYRVYSRLNAGRRAAQSVGIKSMTLNDQGSVTMGDNYVSAPGWSRSASDALYAWRLLTAPPEPVRSADGTTLGYAWADPSAEEEA